MYISPPTSEGISIANLFSEPGRKFPYKSVHRLKNLKHKASKYSNSNSQQCKKKTDLQSVTCVNLSIHLNFFVWWSGVIGNINGVLFELKTGLLVEGSAVIYAPLNFVVLIDYFPFNHPRSCWYHIICSIHPWLPVAFQIIIYVSVITSIPTYVVLFVFLKANQLDEIWHREMLHIMEFWKIINKWLTLKKSLVLSLSYLYIGTGFA